MASINKTKNNQTNSKDLTKILILGAGYAGMLSALRLAGKTKKANVQITLVNSSSSFTERIRLHQLAANQTLPTISIPRLIRGTGISFIEGWITQIDAENQRVTVQQTDGESVISYDKMIYALGSGVDLESVPGVAQHTTALGSPAMVSALGRQIPEMARHNGQLLIVGGGLTGIEAATELAESYPDLQVTLVTRGKFGASLSHKAQAHLKRNFASLGIHIVEDLTVAKVEKGYLIDENGANHPFDLCLWSAGFTVSPLAAEANIATDSQGRILVDNRLASSSHPTIMAIGDGASTQLRMACATALPMGAYAADYLAAQSKDDAMPEAFRFAYAVRCLSLGRHDALVQVVDHYDGPKEQIVSGRVAVFIKETICRYTVWSLWLEKWFPGAYSWPKAELENQTASNDLQFA